MVRKRGYYPKRKNKSYAGGTLLKRLFGLLSMQDDYKVRKNRKILVLINDPDIVAT